MKKGLSGAGMRSYGAGGSAGLLDMWAGKPPPSSDQCTRVPEGCDSTKGNTLQHKEANVRQVVQHNVLASVSFFQTRSFWFGPSLSPSHKSCLYSPGFPRQRFVCGGSSRVVAQVRPHETEMEPFSL